MYDSVNRRLPSARQCGLTHRARGGAGRARGATEAVDRGNDEDDEDDLESASAGRFFVRSSETPPYKGAGAATAALRRVPRAAPVGRRAGTCCRRRSTFAARQMFYRHPDRNGTLVPLTAPGAVERVPGASSGVGPKAAQGIRIKGAKIDQVRRRARPTRRSAPRLPVRPHGRARSSVPTGRSFGGFLAANASTSASKALA
jgi:hypothetical protein